MSTENSRWGELIETLGAADGTSMPPPPDACAEALGEMFLFLDRELDDESARHRIADHLELCVDCVAAYDAEKLVRAVLARSCRGERASVELRQRIELFIHDGSSEVKESSVTTVTTVTATQSTEHRTA